MIDDKLKINETNKEQLDNKDDTLDSLLENDDCVMEVCI